MVKKNDQARCLPQASFVTFCKGEQLVSGSSYAETERLSQLNVLSGLLTETQRLKVGKGKKAKLTLGHN